MMSRNEFIRRLTDAAAEELRDPQHLRPKMFHLASSEALFHGDEDFVRFALQNTMGTLLRNEPFTAVHRLFLVTFICALLDSGASIQSALGAKPGRPRQQGRGFWLAFSVFGTILDKRATSVEEAQRLVAEENHVSFSSVKQHWERWNPAILRIWRQKYPGVDSYLKRGLAAAKRGARSKSGKKT